MVSLKKEVGRLDAGEEAFVGPHPLRAPPATPPGRCLSVLLLLYPAAAAGSTTTFYPKKQHGRRRIRGKGREASLRGF